MNQSNSMSRSLHVFFLDLVTGEVRLILVDFCLRRLGILKTHCFGLVAGDKCHDIADHFSYAGSGCHKWLEPSRWRSPINRSNSMSRSLHVFFLDLVTGEVRLILVDFCLRRPGILKTHCFGLVAGDKCHDIADHFSYAGSGCHT
ncbi:hypothetical protein IGI04_007266 [Brassica rapa subsp. trilocularis]|uniref:Uncharacterized protein n=1 Tax=Brassica rapa subsp. trilocularis TaxID=1813537 RepID=A0ABQ7NJ98_BRACM|nr:hypothetical protein IGI04_007266 [Brassica rapa subsp. trilocularis]